MPFGSAVHAESILPAFLAFALGKFGEFGDVEFHGDGAISVAWFSVGVGPGSGGFLFGSLIGKDLVVNSYSPLDKAFKGSWLLIHICMFLF